MANSKDNLRKYGKAFIGFDETSGNSMDSIGGYTGALVGNPTRVVGWNGKGYAMSFNGADQSVSFPPSIIQIGKPIVIRFKIKIPSIPSSNKAVMGNLRGAGYNGFRLGILGGVGQLYIYASDSVGVTLDTNGVGKNICDDKWHDIMIEFLPNKTVNYYVDTFNNPEYSTTQTRGFTTAFDLNLELCRRVYHNDIYLQCQIDSIEIYDRVISPIPDKYLIQYNSDYKYHDGTNWQSTTPTEENFIEYGMNNLDQIKEKQWKELSGDKSVIMWSDFEDKQFTSVVLNKNEFKAQDLLGDKPQAIYYTDSDTSLIAVETGVEHYSVYDYIGELPTVVVYTESTDDIIVSTKVEPFNIYEEFGDSVEVLYYTDDEDVKEADLILEANWSPVDELEGDFEVVTWTDEAPETAQRALEIKAVPKPQFIKLTSPKRVYGALADVFVNDISKSYRDEARYFIAGEKTDNWYVWSKAENKFVVTDTSTEKAIMKNGMTHKELNSIADKQWRTWNSEYLNIGIFLVDNPRDTIKTIVETVSFEDYLPRNTTTIKDTSLYILNTTAKIDISLDGNVLKGILSDDDLTRVQYRVLLNNGNYYPSDGSFTKLGESPQNIELVIGSKDIRIDDWNTLKIEFQDFYGTTDFYSTRFIGTYSGLMFKDIYGKYFSSEIGEVLQYLDFGIIIAGQTTIEHEIILKNQYGYDVENVHLYANTANFPTGMTCEFSTSQSPFIPQPDLRLNGVLKNNEEKQFFIRLKTELGSTPDANGSFDIIVRADKA
ncbi:LamG-like jellyroll fold domain-containing protein [Lysinibacillus sp. NPDC086135]|uniref:LamG-like jellyroll fold domain-containing protein n=1 Tax=Lysinibacillus sp. NPDC086135 TaxID=3364130 RepID=UPI00382C5A90